MSKVNINDLTPEERRGFMRGVYAQRSHFQNLFGADTAEVACRSYAQALRDGVVRLLLEKRLIDRPVPLEELHLHLSDDMRAYNFDDGVNKISTHFYETDSLFMDDYHKFIREVLQDQVFKVPLYFQGTPTIRIHCPNAKNANHYPRYHTDIGYGHPPEEVNVWIPLTERRDGHSFRLTNIEGSKKLFERFDYDVPSFIKSAIEDPEFTKFCEEQSPAVDTEFGSAFLFDSRCIHTGEPLHNHTRVSIDLRVVPLDDLERMKFIYQGTGRRRVLFAPGHCYSSRTSEAISL